MPGSFGPRYPTIDLHPPLNNIEFGQGIWEALHYSEMAQAPYSPTAVPSADDLAMTAKATTEEINCAPSILTFIASQKRHWVRYWWQ